MSNNTIPRNPFFATLEPIFSSYSTAQSVPDSLLTIDQLAVLLKFGWDEDWFVGQGSAAEKTLLGDIDWGKYASLLQDLMLVAKKLVSPDYARLVHRRLLAACADEATAQTFIGYASTL